jgi:6-phosphogluconolactonase (cycloisomerase 2 family)
LKKKQWPKLISGGFLEGNRNMITKLINLSILATALLLAANQPCPGESSLELTQFLSPSNSSLEGLNLIYSCRLSTDNRFFYSVSMDNSILGVYSRDETTGTLTQIQAVHADIPVIDPDNPPLRALDYTCFSPDDKNLYLLDYKANTIFTYRRYTQNGTLDELQQLTDDVRLNSVGYLDFTPDGKWGVATLYEGDGIAVLKRSSLNGTLTYQSRILNEDIPGVAIKGPNHLIISPDGKFVYVSNIGSDVEDPNEDYRDANIAIFSINNNTGELTYTGRIQNEISVENLVGVRWMDMTEDGSQLYATAALSDTVHLFNRNITTGLLTPVNYWQDTNRHDYPRVVHLSPDEAFVYVNGYDSNTLTQYRRDMETGELSQPITWQNGPSDEEKGLLHIRQIDITQDGKYLYTGGWPLYENEEEQTGLLEYSGIGVFKITNTPDIITLGSSWICK